MKVFIGLIIAIASIVIALRQPADSCLNFIAPILVGLMLFSLLAKLPDF